MTNEYLRLAEPPGLVHPGYPICDACNIQVEHEDGWLCPSCGTLWATNNMEADPDEATMYPEWSGEELTGPVCPNDDAWIVSHFRNHPKERDEEVHRLLEQQDVF